jgi:hypothetical protein
VIEATRLVLHGKQRVDVDWACRWKAAAGLFLLAAVLALRVMLHHNDEISSRHAGKQLTVSRQSVIICEHI